MFTFIKLYYVYLSYILKKNFYNRTFAYFFIFFSFLTSDSNYNYGLFSEIFVLSFKHCITFLLFRCTFYMHISVFEETYILTN